MQVNLNNIMVYQNIMKFIHSSPGGKVILVMFHEVDKTNEQKQTGNTYIAFFLLLVNF